MRGASKVSGIGKARVILRDFHLMPMPAECVRETAAALEEIDPDCVIPMRCAGMPFYEVAKRELPGKVLLSATATKFTFGG